MCKHLLIRSFTQADTSVIEAFTRRTHDNDGYGAIIRHHDGTLSTLKSLDLAAFYLSIGKLVESGTISELVLHHRTSTNGDGLAYAHPFEFSGHLLTHNGVVQVPGKHETKTRNDSEALLHHLIKTGFNTLSINGYFSCFILSSSETVVLVDDKAPIYSDGRVFCSHDLGAMPRIVNRKITFDVSSGERVEESIQVSASQYGAEKRHLSLGAEYQTIEPEAESGDPYALLDMLPDDAILALERCRSEREVIQTLATVLYENGLEASEASFAEVVELYTYADADHGYQYWA